MEEKKERGKGIFKSFLVLFLISGILLGRLLWPHINTIVLAFVLTGIFAPINKILKKSMRPSWASLIVCFLIFLVVFLPIIFFIGSLAQEASALYEMSKGGAISEQIKELLENNQLIVKASDLLKKYNINIDSDHFNMAISDIGKWVGLYLFEQAKAIASNMINFVFHFTIMLIIIFFLFIDGKKLLDLIINLSPLPREQNERLIAKFEEMAGAIIIGNGVSGTLEGILGGIAFAVLDISSPFLWGVIMAIVAFLPFVGISAVFFPAAIYLLLKGRIAAGIALIIIHFTITILIEYVLKTKLVGQKAKMHILLVILSTIGGLKVFGLLGIIYGPLIATMFVTLMEIYKTSYENFVKGEIEQ
ncbi:MAG: AI-2E family transporter [Pseudomonadota bacterium]